MGALVSRYRELVEAGSYNFYGLTITKHAHEIGDLCKRHGASTAIDVGCGRGDQYGEPHFLAERWNLHSIRLYDPAFTAHDLAPQPGEVFDAVLCCDVLEHVPLEEVDEFVAVLFRHAGRFVWASVCCRPAKKCFPGDGLNMHVTVRSFAWWRHKFEAAQKQSATVSGNSFVPFYLIETP
jgi:hypothetical protein